jgi:hypothetical protein
MSPDAASSPTVVPLIPIPLHCDLHADHLGERGPHAVQSPVAPVPNINCGSNCLVFKIVLTRL